MDTDEQISSALYILTKSKENYAQMKKVGLTNEASELLIETLLQLTGGLLAIIAVLIIDKEKE